MSHSLKDRSKGTIDVRNPGPLDVHDNLPFCSEPPQTLAASNTLLDILALSFPMRSLELHAERRKSMTFSE